MGLFGSARKKSNAGPSQSSICQSSEQTKVATNAAIHAQDGILSPTKKLLRRVSGSFHDRSATHQPSSSTRKSLNLLGRFYGNNNEVVESANVIVTMEHLPDLILDLETAVETSAQRPTRSLHMLFALSEHGHNNDNRIEMVRHGDGDIYCADDSDNDDGSPRSCGKLVPALLTFLKRCHVNSQEYRLTLLVLNNISIPFENKRTIALDYGGAKLLAKELCENPSCHLIAIVLVNLTFSGTDLRMELLAERSGIALVESLAFALRLSSLTLEEYEERKSTIEECKSSTPADRLSILMAKDQRLRPQQNLLQFGRISQSRPLGLESETLYPDTARWCLSAVKNLTRPCNDATAAHILIQSGVLSLILQYISVIESPAQLLSRSDSRAPSTSPGSSDSSTVDEADPLGKDIVRDPSTWDSNSEEDTALSIVFNLAACPVSRELMHEGYTVKVLSNVANFPTLLPGGKSPLTFDQRQQLELQCLKARMALSYLIGSQGHFGQSKLRSSASTVTSNAADSDLIMAESDVVGLVELLANCLHLRRKDGPGGYSSVSFSLKHVLFALRCLLTHTSNQMTVTNVAALEVNILLMKVLSKHIMDQTVSNFVDAESAEYACFCLYLLSNYGFEDSHFLPIAYSATANGDKEDEDVDRHDLAAKILTAYIDQPTIRPAGRHAAEQLLLRLTYLNYGDERQDTVSLKVPLVQSTDLELDADVLERLNAITIGARKHGAKPYVEIFHRPVLRSRMPRNGLESKAPWNNLATVSIFGSAIQAVQQLSYGSLNVRHADPIDDIQIANNIADSSNGVRTESYNFLWTWEDKASEIQRNLERQSSSEANSSTLFSRFSWSSDSATQETQSMFFGSFSICATDTTAP